MPNYLLLSRSITHAQQMSAALERFGIRAPYFRAPMALTSRGCSYALRLDPSRFADAMARLADRGLQPTGVFYDRGDGQYTEISRY